MRIQFFENHRVILPFLLGFGFFFQISNSVDAQNIKTKEVQIPGVILVEFGVNRPQKTPENFTTGFLSSRTCNIYYQYEIKPFANALSELSVLPGIGFSFERYRITSNFTLDRNSSNRIILSRRNLSINRSVFGVNYIDIPIEVRYIAHPSSPNRSFKVGLGFRGGYFIRALTKIAYTENGFRFKERRVQHWDVEKWRYGFFFKFGVGNVALVGYYNLTPVFQVNKGPDETQMSNFTIGLSFNGF